MIQFKEFSPKALDFIKNSDARLNILHGSVRSSKTVNCTVRWITFLVEGPPGDLFMVGKTTATLQRNVLNDLRDILGEKKFKWVNKQQGELTLLGRRVYCIGANNEDAESKIRGATIAGAYCDEANLYPESFWTQLMARMSIAGAQCFCNCNPDSPYHWFYKGYIKNDKVTDKKVWHFTMDDNLSLDASYKKFLEESYSGVFYRRYILGEWCVAEGMIYDMFSESTHVKLLNLNDPNTPETRVIRYFIGCDYGTSTVMSWSLMAELADGRIYKVAEYYYNAVKKRVQRTDFEFANDFDAWVSSYPDIKAKGGLWAVYCDPSASSWKQELMRRGYRVINAYNDVINGIRSVGTMLKKEQYLMHPSCVNTIEEYGSYSWDPNAQEKGQDRPIKHNDHACDSDRYALYTFTKYRYSGTY
jgi:PBSX family phage terminase large subunit